MACGCWRIGRDVPLAWAGRLGGFAPLILLLILLMAVVASGWAQQPITGLVRDAISLAPIAGARVQVQAMPETAVWTDANGRFTLPLTGLNGTRFVVAAALPYDADRAVTKTYENKAS